MKLAVEHLRTLKRSDLHVSHAVPKGKDGWRIPIFSLGIDGACGHIEVLRGHVVNCEAEFEISNNIMEAFHHEQGVK